MNGMPNCHFGQPAQLHLHCATRQFGKLCNGCQCERAAGELIVQGRGSVETEEFDFQFKQLQLDAAGRLPGGRWQLIGSQKACRSC